MSDLIVETEYLLLGQGLAGTLLSYRLSQAGVDHLVIDRGHLGSSSNAAAGIVNPVTGRRFVKAWQVEALIEGLSIYKELEKLLGIQLLNRITVYRDLSETSALNQWDMRRNDEAYSPFMGKPLTDLKLPVNVPKAVGPTLQAAQVNLRELINAYRSHLLDNQLIVEKDLSIDDAILKDDRWYLGRFAAKHLIDCTGAVAMQTTTWGKLPWRGTKGEAFRFPFAEMPRDLAIKKKHFICPIGLGDEVWLGGTNQDHYTNALPSDDGRDRLTEQASAFEIDVPVEVEILVGIRPTVNDRRPLVGEHPDKPGIWLCNGFGTRGTSLGPYCTQELLGAITAGKKLNPEVDIRHRFRAG